MIQAVRDGATILSSLPGRVRAHLPGWEGGSARKLERDLRRLPGVRRVEANPVTRNVLVCYDSQATTEGTLLPALEAAGREAGGVVEPEVPPPPSLVEQESGSARARIAVRGLDRNPALARLVVDRLQAHHGVRARASILTGRVLVEYEAHRIDLEDLLAEVEQIELPEMPGEDRPEQPLDPKPLIQSAARTAGAAVGIGVLVLRRLLGATGRPRGARAAATAAGVIGLLRGFPAVRNGLRHLFGRDVADLAFSSANVLTLTFAASPLGLAVIGLESALLLNEVLARRGAWRRYEERVGGAADAEPGAIVRLEAGERAPREAKVIEGKGTAIGRNGLPVPLAPGGLIPAGARLAGGPFVVELQGGRPFEPRPRPAPLAPTPYTRYVRAVSRLSLGYAALTAVLTRSLGRTFVALLLVNPRTAVIGMEAANQAAAARVLRSGVTVVGSRRERSIRRPDLLLLDGPRVLADGFEVGSVRPLDEAAEAGELVGLAGAVSAAAGSPWGNAFPHANVAAASDGTFDGHTAAALVDGVRYTLGPPGTDAEAEALGTGRRDLYWLLLRRDGVLPLAAFGLRPRLAAGVKALVAACERHGVRLEVSFGGDGEAAAALARRAGVPLADPPGVMLRIRQAQAAGQFVAFVSDHADAAPAFAASDLGIGLSSGRSGHFPARADLLANDLSAVAAVVSAGTRRDLAVRDAAILSAAANLFGAVWGFRDRPGVERGSLAVYVSALAALGDVWLRLRGGQRSRSALAYLVDPRPERWGRRSVEETLRLLNAREDGLTGAEAASRRRATMRPARRNELLFTMLNQLRTPVNGVMGGGALLALLGGKALDVAVIGLTVGLNVAVGTWQERQASRTAEALRRFGSPTARVLRDGQAVTLPASALVPGDILVLAPGDRVAADARILHAERLEVDEAALTGESVPVAKQPAGGPAEAHIVLEGSDVVVGTGRAVVVAVGRHTRLGATAAALTLDEIRESPLGARLARILTTSLPIAAAGGALVIGLGLLRGRGLAAQLGVGVSIALSVVPESLPLLAGTGQVGVARRRAARGALLQRLAAVEALGRVDVVCTDKTGTLTEGRLALRLVSDGTREVLLPEDRLNDRLRHVLRAAGLASPHPEAPDASAHPTDIAVLRGAEAAGLAEAVRLPRALVVPFEPGRAFHAAAVDGRLYLKGAPEALIPRCDRVREFGSERAADEAERRALADRARDLAGRGLRVLMVAEGPADRPDDPRGLTALGFVGISDPLRPTVHDAIRRCQAAGVRVVMITGDHPATARAIAREAGLLQAGGEVVTGPELTELQNGELDARLAKVAVVARATPLDKVRIVEGLRRLGHTVAMTGDGVNDAPALRLADVGVAMGRTGTEVARQASDLVLADDDFSTLVEGFVEGRGFWRNMRSGLGLLLGGNLGELGLIVGATLLGHASPLNTAQILVVNMITDALPALALVLRQPEHRNLAGLAREGTEALDAALGRDMVRRGAATGLPALAGYLLARRSGDPGRAQAVAFGGIVGTQLAQTFDACWSEGRIDRPVLGALAGSAGMALLSLWWRPLRELLGLGLPGLSGWGLVGAGAAGSVLLSRALSFRNGLKPAPPSEPTPEARQELPDAQLLGLLASVLASPAGG